MTNEELQARIDALTAQNARLREALEKLSRTTTINHREDNRTEVCYDWCPLCLIQNTLAETPTESLEAVRAEAVKAVGVVLGSEMARIAPEAHPLPDVADVSKLLGHVISAVRAEARLQTLKDIASLVPGIDEGPLDKGSILTRLRDDIVNAVTDRAEEIAKEGK